MRKSLLLALGAALAVTGGAEAATRSMLYVANSQGDDITIIDLATQKVVKTLKVGPIVHGVCAQADGRRAFATIESENSLKVIDTKTSTVTDTIPLGGRPNECAATNDGRYVVVPLLAPANLSVVVDVAEKKIVKSFKTVHPHNCFTPEGGSNSIVYCEERDAFRIHRIDLAKMDITNDEKTLYTALSGLHGFATIDLVNQTMSQTILPPMPWMNCKVEPPNTPTHGIALTPDAKKLWVTSVSDAGVYVYDIASKK